MPPGWQVLNDVLPAHVAQALREGSKVEPDVYPEVGPPHRDRPGARFGLRV